MSDNTDSPPEDTDADDEGNSAQPTEVASGTTVADTDGVENREVTKIPNQHPQATPAQGVAGGGGSSPGGADNLEQEDLRVLIGRHISTNLVQNELDGDVSDELAELLTLAAGRGALQAFNFVQGQLYGDLDENAQNIVFEQTITNPIKQNVIQQLRNLQQQQAEQNN